MTGGPNVRLEPLRVDHADRLYDALVDPALYRYLDEDPPPSLHWLRARYAALEAGAPPDGDERWLNWVIIDAELGPCGTTQATVRTDGPTSIGYVVIGAAQGRGVGRTAVAQTLECLGRDHGVAEVQAEIDPENLASIRLVESLGFLPDGTIGSDRRYVRRLDR